MRTRTYNQSPFKQQSKSENDHPSSQQEPVNLCNDFFIMKRSDPTYENRLTAQQPFPRVRTFTEDELNRMLREYEMTKTYQFSNKHQNIS